ncbi:MAG TPA: TetR family transcriptional regulator [Stackebrandtia sp.]|jgi:AcrR family transcriptional regulator|uniref:TetR/AcrR family transcriptional regulator n=1 Tax=Stackebrandtia sp. TaxID=2023065 RepID=UPI002D2C8155|nr:TetR family transcriptional regulator [Stackebrandtia sp.]HZE41719.1 TetR family transcriptional regulator [Stackebrandtia sp.]
MSQRTIRSEKVAATRDLILTAAERLFAEHGVYAVSNRGISEAAGQGNNAAVGYHFGTKADLVRAIVRKHAADTESRRTPMVAACAGSAELRAWVTCLVRPATDHQASLGIPTWYARFGAQVMTDPALRPIMVQEALEAPSLHQILHGMRRCLPDLPAEVRAEREDMGRQLMVHMLAERERALAENTATPRSNWHDAGSGLIDAITGLWLAPITR